MTEATNQCCTSATGSTSTSDASTNANTANNTTAENTTVDSTEAGSTAVKVTASGAADKGRSMDMSENMENCFNPAEWFGEWFSFEQLIDSTDAALNQAWCEADAAATGPMATHGVRAFWSAACPTTGPDNKTRISSWTITPSAHYTNDGFDMEWTAESGESLGLFHYRLADSIEHGLEGKQTLIFHADCSTVSNNTTPFAWLIAIAPMPPRVELHNGGLLSHLHFQYAADLNTLIDPHTGKLRNNRWYATMCDDSGTLLDRCNIVRALHHLPLWDALPVCTSADSADLNSNTEAE